MFSLDISKWKDGCSIESLKEEGLVHLYLKATEGRNYIDPCLNKFYAEANRLGIPVGFYHFATSNQDIEGQAVDFWNSVKDKPCQLKYCLDMERDLDYNNFVYRFVNKFKEVSGLGDDSLVIYASGYYARDNFNEDIKNKYPLWVAHYGVPAGQYMETGFKTIAGHQYSENEPHQGMEFDANIFYNSITLSTSYSQPTKVVTNNTTTNEYEQHGNAEVLVDVLNVRTSPSLSAEVVAQYHKGEIVYNYDRVYDRDGYRWVRYVGSSGNYRYVAVRDLSDNHRLCNCY